jgi:hypothetical protein
MESDGLIMGKKTAETACIIRDCGNPEAILPYSYPILWWSRTVTETHRRGEFSMRYDLGRDNPLFPFWWGLSYTQFTWTDQSQFIHFERIG